MHAGRKLLQQPARVFVFPQGCALLLAPGQVLLVEPDQHRRCTRHHARRIGKADLQMPLGNNRQVQPEQADRLLHHGPSREYEMGRLDGPALALLVDLNVPHAAAGHAGLDNSTPDELGAVLTRGFEHHHPELLRAQPARAAGMNDRHGLIGEIGKMLADQIPVGDEVGTRQGKIEAAFGRGHVVIGSPLVDPDRTCTVHLGLRCHCV
jgi:hypothetical protein